MPKIYTQTVRYCAECPRMTVNGFCYALHRQLDPIPQVPPKDCPLPDVEEEANGTT